MNIAIMLPNWIGDVVMATPTLRALREHYGPQAQLVGVMRPYVGKVLEGTSWLDTCLLYDRRAPSKGLTTWQLIRKLRQLRLDTFVLLPHSFHAGLLAWASGAGNRVGFVRNGRGILLNRRLYQRRVAGQYQIRSAIDHDLEVGAAVGASTEHRRPELATTRADELGADRVWTNLGLNDVREVILLNTGSANSPARHWPQPYFVDLARRIVTERDAAVLVLCGPGEVAAARQIVEAADHPRVTSMADQDLGIGVAKACVHRASLMVSTDSGPRHYGPAFDVPVVALCGPIDARWNASHHVKSISLQQPVDCGPCGRSHCPFAHHACMRELDVQRVYQAVVTQLQRWPRPQAA